MNGSFEIGDINNKDFGWKGALEVSNNGYHAPVDGNSYGVLPGGSDWVSQAISLPEAGDGQELKVKVWMRSVNDPGQKAQTVGELAFMVKGEIYKSVSVDLNAPQLEGATASLQNDDGANVWVDGTYRHQFADYHLYQSIDDDPIADPWKLVDDSDYESKDIGFAVGQVIVRENRFIYGTYYRDIPGEFYSSLKLMKSTNTGDPDYTWTDPIVLLDHDKTEFPWVLDAHLYYDEPLDQLWMTWGGGIVYVAEMDPVTGKFKEEIGNTEFDTHPTGIHHPVATWPETHEGWCGDEWSKCWMEGGALYKKDRQWYFFGSYGNLESNYTIRMGRGASPVGPFLDKNGQGLMEFTEEKNAYGSSMLLGDEGIQLVPGHPHIWEENGKYYMGYDYRKKVADGEPGDYMGIRRIYWHNGWPTIWQPLELVVDAKDLTNLRGKSVAVAFRNTGETNSKLAVDAFKIGFAP